MGEGRKRIALFVGQADESYQSKFITGFLASAFGSDMDVCVFSMYHKYQNTAVREQGEANIFSLMRPEMFDGAVILEDTIQTADAALALEEKLQRSFDKPVLVIEKDSPYFPSIFTECHDAVVELVSHLIEVHGYKDIAFLSGKKWHKHAKQRLKAVQDALESHGLTLPEDRIIYGDFWYQSGELCADVLLASEKGLPEAVVCANDAMAIGLCKALTERGVKIPADIAVVSYDSTFEGQTAPKSITSSLIPAEEAGRYAAGYMDNIFHGMKNEPYTAQPYLVIGESCGCKHTNIPEFDMKRREWGTDISEEGFDSVNNTMAEELLIQTSLADLLGTVYSYAFQIKGAESFHLCLCERWKYMDGSHNLACPNEGYTDKMIYAVRYRSDRKDGLAGLERIFDTEELLPELAEPADKPRAWFFTPVFFENQNFGYAAVEYGSAPRSYDETYRRWIGLVSRGIEGLRRAVTARNLQTQLDKLKSGKFAAMTAAYDRLDEDEKADYELVTKILDDNLLSYRFQPIVNAKDGGIYSYEALMRSATDKRVPPLSIVKYADMQNRLADVERATFKNVLALVEDNMDIIGDAKIFINSIPGVRLTGEDMEEIEGYLKHLGDTVVVELTEEAEMDDADLNRLKEMFKRMDVKIAVDDYGTGYSNVSNLLRYMPDYVKIDRVLLSDVQNKPQKQHFVKEVINFCHDNGIMALAEGIETTEELRACILLGADLIQGFYTGKPDNEFIGEIDEKVRHEIARYHEEYENGGAVRQYVAGKTNRVALTTLVRDGVSEIVVGQGAMIYKDITVFGTPGVKTNVHIRVEPDYRGRITLENACLSNDVKNPCIDLGENADVALVIVGENTLKNTGIRVPKSARLTLEGDGNLKIELRALDFYGIGNLPAEEHGELFLAMNGSLNIGGHGVNGACIGSGLGGKIRVVSGSVTIDADGHDIIGIGALSGNADVVLENTNISVEFNAQHGGGIGAVTGSSSVSVEQSSIKIYGDGNEGFAIGNLSGRNTELSVENSGVYISMNGVVLTAVGSLSGSTVLRLTDAMLKMDIAGDKSLALGGENGDVSMIARRSDIKWTINNTTGLDCCADSEDIVLINSGQRFIVNGEERQRPTQTE
ncbi:EAL domain-containing protein [Ruminococcus sp.]|uniref:EAL domain-containing protein n=1 Tax=Ruminococcus sp. TaxID=41978 RepID=UPI0025EFFEE2|nr:EAL domain-containing protein [Ruminococcus sp.]MBQ8965541.1 EAL domain-containing protein [Ruminococcus sp.]